MNYKNTLKNEQALQRFFEKYGDIPNDIKSYKIFLGTRHHHEILPERLYLISRIEKSITKNEKRLYIKRYKLLEKMNPNSSWTEYVNKL